MRRSLRSIAVVAVLAIFGWSAPLAMASAASATTPDENHGSLMDENHGS